MNFGAVYTVCRKSGCYARAVVLVFSMPMEQRLLAMAVNVLAVVPIGKTAKSLHLRLVEPRLLS